MTVNPIEAVVMPLKADAVKRAEKYAGDVVLGILADMERAGWDLKVAAPMPPATMRRADYKQQMSKHKLYARMTKATWATRRPSDPDTRARDVDMENKFIEDAKKDAAAQYDLFVAKLVQKIGPVHSAKLDGSHVWDWSILTVEKKERMAPDAQPITVRELWKTQQIMNVSKLGKVFNQWPTRKVKHA